MVRKPEDSGRPRLQRVSNHSHRCDAYNVMVSLVLRHSDVCEKINFAGCEKMFM